MLIPCFQEHRLCLHLSYRAESPRVASATDCAAQLHGPTPRPEGLSRYGVIPSSKAEDFPRHYLPAIASSLIEAAGEGFAVMSGSSHEVTLVQGNSLTRQGISLP